MERYEINKTMEQWKEKIQSFEQILNLDSLLSLIKELEEQTVQPSFWDTPDEAQKVVAELNALNDKKAAFYSIQTSYETIEEFIELDDDDFQDEIEQELHHLGQLIEQLELELLLSGKYDHSNAIIDIHPGAGGTESQDWALMLFEMYSRYAELHNYKVEVLNYQSGDEAGLKSATLLIIGHNAYGYLKAEQGVHRLVRISPFDSNSRRHTSFASVDVMPEIDDSIELDIRDEDLKIDTYRSTGAGGQSVNTTDSAVRIKHIPTGVVVTCQNERSQIANRKKAMDYLRAKLFQIEEEKKREELASISGEKRDINFGSQIRSYVLHPYSMVKDHRTNYESSNPGKVFAGNIDDFIYAYLKVSA